MISTRIHGILDYILGIILILYPWITGFNNYTMSPWVMMGAGIIIIIYSLFTRYEYGYAGFISMNTHIWLDLGLGAVLAFSPWIFRFAYYTYLPQVIFGGLMMLAALFTNRKAIKVPSPNLTPRTKGMDKTTMGEWERGLKS